MLFPDRADAKPIKQSQISEDYSGAISESTKNVLGVAVLDYPYPQNQTYIFYWNANNQTLAYLLKTTLPEGVSLYSDHTVTVDSITITTNFQNAPLACARTSDGKVSTQVPKPYLSIGAIPMQMANKALN